MSSTASAGGCPMVDGIYLRANGELACWGHFGDIHVLGKVSKEWLREPGSDLLEYPAFVAIRDAFRGGRLPFPDLCPLCPVLGDGMASRGRPDRLDKLLIEPSYLCQLDCPACFSAAKRNRLGEPPYLLEPDLLEAFLERLAADGIRELRFVHLEGRGDPMMGPHTWTLVRLIHRAFPMATIQMTSHGVYDFDPEVFDSGLDILRFSIDGATAESYARYRIGGDFDRGIGHLRGIRDHRRRHRSRLKVVWKYLVFEWNDSREEMARAAEMAEDLEVELLFVLAEEGTGRSKRLGDLNSLVAELQLIAPRAMGYECLDQLDTANHLQAEHDKENAVASTLMAALEARRAGQQQSMVALLRRGLALDSGSRSKNAAMAVSEANPLPGEVTGFLIAKARFPSTLSAFANLALELGEWRKAYSLFRCYLRLGPEATDREAVEDQLVGLALRWHLGSDDPGVGSVASDLSLRAAEDAILAVDPGRRPGAVQASSGDAVSEWIEELELRSSMQAIRWLRKARGDHEGEVLLVAKLAEKGGI